MPVINIKKVENIITQIRQNEQQIQQYESKWHKIENFLNSNIGEDIADISTSGSKFKGTSTKRSDLDIIFYTKKPQKKEEFLSKIHEKALENFNDVAEFEISENAVRIKFIKPKCDFDIVYLNKKEFKKEKQDIKNFKKAAQYQKDAIILIKYVIDKEYDNLIPGYRIEKWCIKSNCKSLESCINNLIHLSSSKLLKQNKMLGKFQNYII